MITVLFDGVCNLCNRAVDCIMRNDPRQTIRLAAQQSAAGQRLLAEAGAAGAAGQTMVVLADGRVYLRSAAALRLARALRWPWPLLYALVAIPRPLRDAIYNWVVRHRYAWFGKRDTCRVPTAAERAWFIE